MTVSYLGGLRCEALHEPSGNTLLTDAPRDNQGKGEAFSPTDLVATALATCMATTMGIVAGRHGIDLAGLQVKVVKEMTSSGPRKIAQLTTDLYFAEALTPEQEALLEQAALGCPVHKSLHPDLARPVTFHWPDAAAGSELTIS